MYIDYIMKLRYYIKKKVKKYKKGVYILGIWLLGQ